MHKGTRSDELDLPGILSVTESTQIARDVLLAEATGCHYHVCHVSTKESVRVIRDAKRAGIHVTAEVAPHHLILIDGSIPTDTAIYKMNPPLRGAEDRAALIEGLLDGTIDCIATDHAPHGEEEKQGGMVGAPFGIVGIDMIAGPSEILVVSDGSGNPDWVAMDLFSQAEHDELAQSILLCPNAAYIAVQPLHGGFIWLSRAQLRPVVNIFIWRIYADYFL